MVNEGHNAREIGAALGLPRRRVLRWARSARIDLVPGGDGRQLRVQLRQRIVRALDRVAREAGVSRSEIVQRLMLVAFDGRGHAAREILGKFGRPKRSYTPRRVRAGKQAA